MISKLMKTSALLLAGALVSFGADDMNANKMKTSDDMKKVVIIMNDQEYNAIVDAAKNAKNVAGFKNDIKEKLKNNDAFMAFVKKFEEKNPNLRTDVKKKITDFKNKLKGQVNIDESSWGDLHVIVIDTKPMAEVKKASNSTY